MDVPKGKCIPLKEEPKLNSKAIKYKVKKRAKIVIFQGESRMCAQYECYLDEEKKINK